MKQVFKTLVVTALLSSALLSSVAYAEQKIAVVSREAVIQQMPQAIASQQALQIEFKDEGSKVDAMRQKIATDLESLKKNAPTMSEAQIKAEQERLQAANTEFEALAKPLQEKLQKRRQEENTKIVTMLQQAIQAVVNEENIDMVLDRQAVVFATPQYDISEKVLKKVSQMK
ncbi:MULTISPECIES: OmpH family outer membrane protein [Alteromonadaceae]|uniref:OmpH family outer membrane protein n=1 Tax=Alteromonadaceae TaxID=72275 RepID=UPI001C099E13|nr:MULTISPECIES: OmpH family outer membrane protein [Aliiglaciecola]MBU2879655.1 OmpH family outer membrane protein [Aliiglaciecola lipolytica]MDO6710066.1 OmpH family outer membrane protein [Aliiglaciecola sp. 2_MG-2023]MDO6751214.1 OmpH family outer membrane protein [Aliiglaciecola sp. 1_MG-2023]